MTDPQIAIFMLCLFIVLVLLGFPIAFTLIAMGVGFGYYAYYQGGIETFSDVFNKISPMPLCLQFGCTEILSKCDSVKLIVIIQKATVSESNVIIKF